MLNLDSFISGLLVPIEVFDTPFGERLEGIRPTNLDKQRPSVVLEDSPIGPFSWLKVLLVGAFGGLMTQIMNLSIKIGKPLGQLGYNAQYPYLQKGLRARLSDDSILVYEGTANTPLIVRPTAEQDTIVIVVAIVRPVADYVLVPFVISTEQPLVNAYRKQIEVVAKQLRFAGMKPRIIGVGNNQPIFPIHEIIDYETHYSVVEFNNNR